MAEKKGRAELHAQFSKGSLDFQRLDNLEKMIDEMAVRVNSGDHTAIKAYFAAVKQFYKNIRVLVLDIETMDKMLKGIQIKVRNYDKTKADLKNNMAMNILEDMDDFTDRLYNIKQYAGLGFSTHKVFSTREKWARGVGRKK